MGAAGGVTPFDERERWAVAAAAAAAARRRRAVAAVAAAAMVGDAASSSGDAPTALGRRRRGDAPQLVGLESLLELGARQLGDDERRRRGRRR